MENSARSPVYNDALRNISIDPIENNYSAVRDEISLESAEDYFDSGLFMPRARLLQHGLNGCNELRHLRCRFPKMRVDDVLSFKQFDLDAALPGYVSFLVTPDAPTVILDAPAKQGMELPCISGLASLRAQSLAGSASRCIGE